MFTLHGSGMRKVKLTTHDYVTYDSNELSLKLTIPSTIRQQTDSSASFSEFEYIFPEYSWYISTTLKCQIIHTMESHKFI